MSRIQPCTGKQLAAESMPIRSATHAVSTRCRLHVVGGCMSLIDVAGVAMFKLLPQVRIQINVGAVGSSLGLHFAGLKVL